VFYDAALEASNFGAGDLIVALEQFTPALISELGGAFGGIDDVGEKHCGQDAIDRARVPVTGEELLDLTGDRFDVPHPRPVVDAVEFDQPCPGDLRGQLTPVLQRDYLVSTVQNKGGNPHASQDVADVDLTNTRLKGQKRHPWTHAGSFKDAHGSAVQVAVTNAGRRPFDRASLPPVVD